MLNETELRSAVGSALNGSDLDVLVDDYSTREKIAEIIQEAIVGALKEYDRQQNQ